MTRYWIIVASKDHTQKGVEGGFAQACHGKASPLKRMKKGDFVIYYSSKLTFGKSEPCQKFTAIGKVTDNEVYPFQMTETFCPYRRNIEFFKSKDISILELIHLLDFIPNKKSWGYPFRYGILEIKENDFNLIASKMLENE